MFYEPHKGHGLPRDPFNALVAPRPIGWISTRAADGAVNLAPYSFFNIVSSKPPLVMFSSSGGKKHSASFAEETGEFVVNLVSRDLVKAMNASSVDAPRGVSEFEQAAVTAAPCRLVRAPRVAEAPAALECRVTEIFQPKALDGSASESTVVIGQVVGIHIDDAFLKDGFFDVARAGNAARLGYLDFSVTSETFAMQRPRWPDPEG